MGASKEETDPLFLGNNCWRCDVPLGKLDFNSDVCKGNYHWKNLNIYILQSP